MTGRIFAAAPEGVAGRVAWMLVVALLAAACGNGDDPAPERRPGVEHTTMTQAQATDRVEQILRQTVAALQPRPRLELFKPLSQPHHCDDDVDDPRMVVPRTYWLRDVGTEHNAAIGDQVKKAWEDRGYLIEAAQGLGTDQPDIMGRTRPDDFLIALHSGDNGQLSIGATSPCVWPNGTPEPSSP